MKINFMVEYIIDNKHTIKHEPVDIFELYYNFAYSLKNSLEYIQNYKDEPIEKNKKKGKLCI